MPLIKLKTINDGVCVVNVSFPSRSLPQPQLGLASVLNG